MSERRDLLEIRRIRQTKANCRQTPGDVPPDFLSLKFRAQNPLRAIREKVCRLLLWERGGGSQVRRGRLSPMAVPHEHQSVPQEA